MFNLHTFASDKMFNIIPFEVATATATPVVPEPSPETVIYKDSFFIPHVHEYISLEQLVFLIESSEMGLSGLSSSYSYVSNEHNTNTKMCIVEKIESIPKTNQKDGHPYYSCFVYVKWHDSAFAKDVQHYLNNDRAYRLYYRMTVESCPQYIVMLPNKSHVTQMPAPRHVDLCLCLPSFVGGNDVVFAVMEGLDLGKVCETEAFDMDENTSYMLSSNENTTWEHVNPTIWEKKMNVEYKVVYVHFEYWYKTQTAYRFQEEMDKNHCVKIPIANGLVWTFYEMHPKYPGINPYVWVRNQV